MANVWVNVGPAFNVPLLTVSESIETGMTGSAASMKASKNDGMVITTRLNPITIHDQDQLHMVLMNLDRLDVDSRWIDLDDSERKRAENYKIRRVAEQFLLVRSELKRQLGQLLNCEPRHVVINLRPDGKPEISDSNWHFNVSHSGEFAMIAISHQPIGVDVEQIREMPNARDLLKRFFTIHEFQQYEQLPDALKHDAFFRAWTCKEAVLKADGRGIRIIEACEIDLDPRNEACVVSFADNPFHWKLKAWTPVPGWAAALAMRQQPINHVK
jgi:4'-phosphopantetheinyl transferase